jgi:hypothetical protein
MAEDDLTVVETGMSPEPIYDQSTHMVSEPTKDGGKLRDPFPHESVRAAFQKQRADRDPVERYRQTAEHDTGRQRSGTEPSSRMC